MFGKLNAHLLNPQEGEQERTTITALHFYLGHDPDRMTCQKKPAPETLATTCPGIRDKKQCKQSPDCKWNKHARHEDGNKGLCEDEASCADLTVKTCKKRKNKKRCKLVKT